MDHLSGLLLTAEQRDGLWRRLEAVIEHHLTGIRRHRVAPRLDPKPIRALLEPLDFQNPMQPEAALDLVVDGLQRFQVHTPHPGYYGLFNPATTPMSIAGDTLTALFNPQMAAWSHSPFGIEIEQHLIRAFAPWFGYDPAQTCGTFATAGTEANHTAVLTALVNAFPDFMMKGARGLPGQPVMYVCAEAHHSMHRAARLCGLGAEAVRDVPVDSRLSMDMDQLVAWIAEDRRAGRLPFLISGTAGTTNAGMIDPLVELADIAKLERLWFHVDAAWGGAVALVPEYRDWLKGIERSDSITFDLHKWLQVPMGAGLYLSRHRDILDRTFRMSAAYMPREAAGLPVVDPWTQSMQWTRRFIALKCFLTLAVAGWSGYQAAIRHMVELGRKLRRALAAADWDVVNPTPLPLACFVDKRNASCGSPESVDAIAYAVVATGKAWISPTRVGGDRAVLRACITNYRTEAQDVETLVAALDLARRKVASERDAASGGGGNT